ncbi:uncharacterized protein METZ01_LOCUS345439 [marine metagenome]|uniref:DUF2065 domain-containing protein n=1 Tax=marine metagenome TaxID=408172 RepID=A0A382R600_9ZZZZ
MAWSDLLAGFAFFLMIEGLLPFVRPDAWRRGISILSEMQDGQLRRTGFIIVVAGLALLYLVRA